MELESHYRNEQNSLFMCISGYVYFLNIKSMYLQTQTVLIVDKHCEYEFLFKATIKNMYVAISKLKNF